MVPFFIAGSFAFCGAQQSSSTAAAERPSLSSEIQSSQAEPKLTVETSDHQTYTLKYQILPKQDSVTEAWIEVWDRPKLLLRKSVPISAAGSMDWSDTSNDTPDELRIALLDPDAPKGTCIDSCTPEQYNAVYPSSELLAGVGPNGDEHSPELQIQAFRVVAGTDGVEVSLAGNYFTPESRLVVGEMTSRDRWDLQFAPVEYVDMHHLKGWIPADLLTLARVLPLTVWPSPEEMDRDEDTSRPFPYDASVIVVCKDSPRLDRLEPSEVAADAADQFALQHPVDETQLTDEEVEQRHSIVARVLGSGFNSKSRVVVAYDPLQGNEVKTEFVSAQELRIWLRSGLLKGNVGQPLNFWVMNDRQGCGISESRIVRVLPSEKIPLPTPTGWITVTEPYPVPLMAQSGPDGLELTIRGENFRPNDTVVAAVRWYGDGGYKNLKTTFISSEELRAWLPREMWRIHRVSFRFVIHTVGGERATEVEQPE